jgi:outer membrane protein
MRISRFHAAAMLGFCWAAMETVSAQETEARLPLPEPEKVAPDFPAAAPSPKIVPLSLAECVRMALAKNIDISIQRLEPAIARADTLSAQGAFDPFFRLDAEYGESSSPRTDAEIAVDGLQSRDTHSTAYEASIGQTTATGATVEAFTNAENSEDSSNGFRDDYSSFVGARFTQPLLRNFGTDVNLAPVRIARRGEVAADAGFQFQVEQIVSDTATAYFELIFTREDLIAREKSLVLAEQLLEDNKIKVELGTLSPLDISQANAEVAARKEEVIRARRTIRDQENTLKRLITDDVISWLDRRIVPTDPADEMPPLPATLDNIASGLRNRADYRQSIEQAEQQKLQVIFAQNQLLPQLDLRASYGYAGLGDNFGSTYDRTFEGEDNQWFVGFTLEIPWFNRTERGQLDSAKLQKEQALLTLKRLEQDIIVQIDNANGQAVTNRERVDAAHAARILAEESLAAEQEKLSAGASTSFVVLQLQRDLTTARSTELRAIADYQQSIVELQRVQGIVLSKNNIILDRKLPSPSSTSTSTPTPTASPAKP